MPGGQTFFIVLVVLVGVVLPAQAGINAELRRNLGHPFLAGIVNFGGGLVILAVAALSVRTGLPKWSAIAGAPWWAYLGGLCGAALVLAGVVAAPRLGAALLIASLVMGQLVASVVIDHFGFLGYAVRPVTLARVAGVLLLAGGVFLVQRG
ncbi:MAG: DMT family transporter [Polyangiaceae bacterium]|nr:DMT family transporter [Myxococcales bacterium]MCB9589053.1 DMT family transporter [Polyangiaceae bacterium]